MPVLPLMPRLLTMPVGAATPRSDGTVVPATITATRYTPVVGMTYSDVSASVLAVLDPHAVAPSSAVRRSTTQAESHSANHWLVIDAPAEVPDTNVMLLTAVPAVR